MMHPIPEGSSSSIENDVSRWLNENPTLVKLLSRNPTLIAWLDGAANLSGCDRYDCERAFVDYPQATAPLEIFKALLDKLDLTHQWQNNLLESLRHLCIQDTPYHSWFVIQKNYIHISESVAYFSSITEEFNRKKRQGITVDQYPPALSEGLALSIYNSNHSELITLFKQFFPTFFSRYCLPPVVSTSSDRIFHQYGAKESDVIKIQRRRRAVLRQREEVARLTERKEWPAVQSTLAAKHQIQKASQPYIPRTSPQLAKKIITTAQTICLYPTVRHLTSNQYICNIFNEALYGHKTLKHLNKDFKPAALTGLDILEGDGNAICLGSATIDDAAMKPDTLELVFDLKKIQRHDLNAFTKQADFGFLLRVPEFTIPFKNLSLEKMSLSSNGGFTRLSIHYHFFSLPNYALINYNLAAKDSIFILNFFKFLDSTHLGASEQYEAMQREAIRQKIYAELATYNEQELKHYLTLIGQALSHYHEFNFYGAHQIDFSTLQEISYYPDGEQKTYTLNLKALIQSFATPDTGLLREAIGTLLNIFKSYRFVQYLLSRQPISGEHDFILKRLLTECSPPTPPYLSTSASALDP